MTAKRALVDIDAMVELSDIGENFCDLYEFKTRKRVIEKALEILEILKNKRVNISMLMYEYCYYDGFVEVALEAYNKKHYQGSKLTIEEFEKIMEWLENE